MARDALHFSCAGEGKPCILQEIQFAMKHFLVGLFLSCMVASSASPPKIEQCFKVHRLLKSDAIHYWADWTNTCPFIIDSVYVEVGFLDHARKQLGEGVWPMYFVLPGVHRVTRFSVPVGVDGFEIVQVSRITTDAAEALRRDKREIQAAEHDTVPPGTVPDAGASRVLPAQPATISTVR
jgi:hypothetical protein